jgi:hypothetical protein
MRKFVTILFFSILFELSIGQTIDTTSKVHNKSIQECFPKNSVFVEFLGNSMFYSLNYERIFFPKYRLNLSLRSGFCYIPEKKFGTIGFPILTNGILKITRNIFFELGVGVLILAYDTYNTDVAPSSPDYIAKGAEIELTGAAGLRFKSNKGFLFRIDYTPIFMTYHKDYVSWGGISLGYCF